MIENGKRRRVVHFTSVHSPFDNRIARKECTALTDAGFDVVLVARHDGDRTDGRIPLFAVPKRAGRLARMTRSMWEVYRAARQAGGEFYHFHDPELLPVGVWLKLCGKRVIYDAHEHLPRQIRSKHWIPRPLRLVVAMVAGTVERVAARLLDGVIAATPVIAQRFPRRKTETVQNFPILDEMESVRRVPYGERPMAVAYVGAITEVRGIREMVQALDDLPADVRLNLAGSFSPAGLRADISQMLAWERVNFTGFRSRDGVVELLKRSRVGLVLLHPVPNYLDALPVKLFEYMAAGLPVVASDFPLWREIVDAAGCGLLVDPCDPKTVVAAIRRLLENPIEAEAMGQRGREAVERRYNWATEADKLVRFYRRIDCGRSTEEEIMVKRPRDAAE